MAIALAHQLSYLDSSILLRRISSSLWGASFAASPGGQVTGSLTKVFIMLDFPQAGHLVSR